MIWAEIQKDLFSGMFKRVQAAFMYSVPKSHKDLNTWNSAKRAAKQCSISETGIYLTSKKIGTTCTLPLLGMYLRNCQANVYINTTTDYTFQQIH